MTNAYGFPFLRRSTKPARPGRPTSWEDADEPVGVVPLPCTTLSHGGQTFVLIESPYGSRFMALPAQASRPSV